jgi:hemolysin III
VIASTYTPFLLVKMRTPLGWTFLVLIWTLALFGAGFKMFFTSRFVVLSTLMYLAMGWLSVLLAQAMLDNLGVGGTLWVAAGGLAYTVGVVFFLWPRLRFNHAIWHLFVIAGSACHYLVVVRYLVLG